MPPDDAFQSAYTYDAEGRRVIIGLSFDETREFERIDARLPFRGKPVWPGFGDDIPLLPMEARWLELWNKHEAALQERRAQG
jgi:hypothetical protein